MLLESTNAGGQHRLPAADDVGVGQVQPERVDGLIALQVGLLVHRHCTAPDLTLATSARWCRGVELAVLLACWIA